MPLATSHSKGSRRYLIHGDRFLHCTLVYEPDGGWYVEKTGGEGVRVRLTLREFEKTAAGKMLGPQMEAALHEAERDV